jgi:hypothetical protein
MIVERAIIENAIEALIRLLDAVDGDADLEPEDCSGECPDDVGELDGETFRGVLS